VVQTARLRRATDCLNTSQTEGHHLSSKAILVTGGAGYIGSHVVRQLGEAGEQVIVLDSLIKGFRQAVTAGDLIVGDVGDYELVSRILAEHQVDTVMHFAAHISVAESMANPLKYYANACGTRTLLQVCQENDIKHFIFSSSASVYGVPRDGYADETSPTQPINAYGSSKLISEWMLRDLAAVCPLRYVALRYFNVAGCDPTGKIGHSTKGSHLLTKVACEAVVGKRPYISLFGTDYPTPDGTCVRDYLHIEDLAAAHLDALKYLRASGKSTTLNVGYGHGYSVREVLRMVERLAGQPLAIREEARRPGDPAYLVARAERIRAELGWQPRFDDLHSIVSSNLIWERKLLSNPWN
jgi:UDP-glucose 4-epimerase